MTTAVVLTDVIGTGAIANQWLVYVSKHSAFLVVALRLVKPPSVRMNRSRTRASGARNLAVFIGSRSYTFIFASIINVSGNALGGPYCPWRVPPMTNMFASSVCTLVNCEGS